MLRIAPSAEVHPAVVVLIDIVEHDDEAFISTVLAGTSLELGVTAAHSLFKHTDASLLHAGLCNDILGYPPLTLDGLSRSRELERSCCAPCGKSIMRHCRTDCLLPDHSFVGIILLDRKDSCSHILCHQLLNVIGRGTHHFRRVETNHVGLPCHVVLVDKDRCVACHLNNVGIVLHTHHKDSFAKGSIQITDLSESLCDSILATVDLRTAPGIGVILMEVVGKPHR